MKIKVGQMPGTLKKMELATGTTIGQAIDEAGFSTAGYEVRLGTEKVTDLDTELSDGNRIVLAKQIKGNLPKVKVGQMPGTLKKLDLPEGATIQDAIDEAGFSTSGYEVRLGTEKVGDTSTELSEGNRVVLAKQIKGNATVDFEGGVEMTVAYKDETTVELALESEGIDTEDVVTVFDKDGDMVKLDEPIGWYDGQMLHVAMVDAEAEEPVSTPPAEEPVSTPPADIDDIVQDFANILVDELKARGIKGYTVRVQVHSNLLQSQAELQTKTIN